MNEDGTAGPWPEGVPTTRPKSVKVGQIVRSISGEIEGRTTGSRRPCISIGCPGCFIGVNWETGQQMHICSKGWCYDPESGEFRVVAGGEISARYVSPKPLGTPPLPRDEWPDRSKLGPAWKTKNDMG